MGASRSALVAATGAGEDDRIMFQELVSENIVADLVPLILEPINCSGGEWFRRNERNNGPTSKNVERLVELHVPQIMANTVTEAVSVGSPRP